MSGESYASEKVWKKADAYTPSVIAFYPNPIYNVTLHEANLE